MKILYVREAKECVREMYVYRAVLRQLVLQQLILRYRRTALGYLWTLLNPLLMMSIMAFVFSDIYKTDVKSFAIFLFCGMVPWNFFSSVINQASTSFIQNESLIKKVYLPKIVFPLSISLALLIDSLSSTLVLLIIVFVIGDGLTYSILLLPIAYLLLYVFTLGIGLTMSVATVYFRDLQHITQIGLQGLFFLTPILYKINTISGWLEYILKLNPLVPFIGIFRYSIGVGDQMGVEVFLHAGIISIASILLGLYCYLKNKKNIVFRL